MNSRGISQIFVWIFVIVAGGMLLVMFAFVAGSQLESGKDVLAAQALQELDAILATQQASPNTFSRIPIPAEKVTLQCADTSTGYVSQMEIEGFSRSLENSLVVGQDLETDELLLFSRELLLPFDVGNVLFLSSADDVLVLQDADSSFSTENPSSSMQALLDIIPKQLQPRVNEGSLGKVSAADRTIRSVVVSNGPLPNPNSVFVRPRSVRNGFYLHVQFDPGSVTRGVVHVYGFTANTENLANPEPFAFVTPEMALAYVWQASSGRMSCFQKKLQQRLSQQASLQASRMDALDRRTPDICNDKLRSPYIHELIDSDIATLGNTRNYFFALADTVEQVAIDNENLLRGSRCGTIY